MLYHPKGQSDVVHNDITKPLMAHVVHVHNDDLVNLVVFDSVGHMHRRHHVPIVQEGGQYTAGDLPYAEWMPYQKGQAAKYEAEKAKHT